MKRGVQADGSIKFELTAPNAKEVSVEVEETGTLPMTLAEGGVWSCLTKPLSPNLYAYSFKVDGTTVLDPQNPVFVPNLIWPSNMVLVPGNPPELWEWQEVPHGNLTRHFYKSGIIGDQRSYLVYTPPGYDPKGRAKYPVLYLLHGYSDTEEAWSVVGKANILLDNLIAAAKASPMLVVMPLGYGVSDFATPGRQAFGDKSLTRKNYDQFRDSLLSELIPRIEKDYQVSPNRKGRAIAGLSMGGAETLYVGLNHLSQFNCVGSFSAGGLGEDFSEMFPGLLGKEVNRSLKHLIVSCGTEDRLLGFNRNLVKWLNENQVKVSLTETPGDHSWMVWRRDLIEFVQKIFPRP